ncbi:uncharacterized protein PHACADRAFT_179168 [Phanerochaete carnosa HHB-10118-sp]|uniref:AB hydrolase-1 domain-containing protein n=1 Tax=Phanerochaete carnosa (strain HHB-10118-sp) TaxID=650164 RepID=K5UJR8_PHACS|nr:uncharacterized protein PHACADRAFT_179168 [Phanerochaete carnosa HHB-10118-sp]EKM49786.1 hypothetical protein PHACADRAFT_179168 [Phanerochaete carnosa HHB-10118-sp]
MPTAPVDDKGTVFYYEDTGAPNGLSDYLTVVLVHGLTFHSGAFRRVLPYATTYNLRFVTVNMRDYPGSTGYTPEELNAFADPDFTVQDAALRTHGEQLAAFLEYLVRSHEIQPIETVNGKRTKGIALVAWSMGNLLTMTFLGNASKFSAQRTAFLAKYLRTVVMLDPSKRPTIERMSKDELESITDAGVLERSSMKLFQASRDVLYPNVLRALVDTQGVWPDVNVLVFWCDESMHDCIWAAKFISDLGRAPSAEGKQKRRIDVERLWGVNHFVHWDAPETFVTALTMRL